MTNILVVGPGFIGAHVTEALVRNGHCVRVLARRERSAHDFSDPDIPVEWIVGSFTDEVSLARSLGSVETVYHFGWTSHPSSSDRDPARDAASNVLGSLKLLEQARRSGARRVIFASSGGTVYGIPQQIPIPEDHPTWPICAYGVSKLAVEKYLHMYFHLYGLEFVILRYANPFGERQRTRRGQGIATTILERASNGLPIEIWGDGSVIRDFIYIDDVVEASLRAMRPEVVGQVLNVGSGVGTSINELIAACEKVIGRKSRLIYLSGRKFDVPVNVLDINRIRNVLGWQPLTDLMGGLERTYGFLANQVTAK